MNTLNIPLLLGMSSPVSQIDNRSLENGPIRLDTRKMHLKNHYAHVRFHIKCKMKTYGHALCFYLLYDTFSKRNGLFICLRKTMHLIRENSIMGLLILHSDKTTTCHLHLISHGS